MHNSVHILKKTKTQPRQEDLSWGRGGRVSQALPALSIYAVNWVALGIFACCA